VLDLRDPLAPRRRGAVALPIVARRASSTLGTFGVGLTVAGAFAYLARDTLVVLGRSIHTTRPMVS